ncbi:hypothetical protein BSKO_11882 [Bryopsis sp. KO-2023]|nr:hypothetical protein BSKO_11882 [Bryopsis sp. KO-2023]
MDNGGEPTFATQPPAHQHAHAHAPSLDYDLLGDTAGLQDVPVTSPQGSLYPPRPQPPPSAPILENFGSTETVDLNSDACPFRLSVTSPVKETVSTKVPGVPDQFYTYLVNTSTTLSSFSSQEMSVRRRFRDFVDMAHLLKENYRGYFVPPRPHRNMYQGKIRMSPTFIEQRRKSLEKYLRQLAAHPVISRSEELRVFLEARGLLRECMAWIQLHPVSPPWYEGAVKLIRQISGRERSVPTAQEVAQPINAKRDMLRSMKETMKSFKEKRAPSIFGGKEQALRNETEVMQEFKTTVDQAWKWASIWMDRVDSVGRCYDSFGTAIHNLHNFELDSGYCRMTAPAILGKGSTRSGALHRQFVNQSALPLSHLHDYTELMVSVLKALHAREDALNTVTTLQSDMAAKKAKLANLESTPGKSKQVAGLNSDISALENSIIVAQSSYDRVSAHNTQEMARLRTTRQMEWQDMLRGLATSQATFAAHSTEVWCQVAEELGADSKLLAPLRIHK